MRELSLLITSVLTIIFMTACNEKTTYYTVEYEVNEPVFMAATEFRKNAIGEIEAPQPIEQQGKICFYEGYLYIAEPEKGIHIIDNRNPANPVNKGFIQVMGIHDIAIRENLLYADSFVDMVWFTLSNPAALQFEGRLENVFPYALPVVDNEYSYDTNHWYEADKADKVVVGWKLISRKIEYEVDRFLMYDSEAAGSSAGVNGSFSLFNVYNDYLYTIVNNELVIFNLSSSTPVEAAREREIGLGMQVETIFRYGENLFLGTPDGMLIYSAANPVKPEYQSTFRHIYGCDPVVVEEDVAYITVRSGNTCGQNVDVLYLIDISDLKNPEKIAEHVMKNPKGLGIDKKLLFVCDDGLKIYKAEDPKNGMFTRQKHITGMHGHDVIPYNNVLMMIAENAIYQYDYSNPENIIELSKLSFK